MPASSNQGRRSRAQGGKVNVNPYAAPVSLAKTISVQVVRGHVSTGQTSHAASSTFTQSTLCNSATLTSYVSVQAASTKFPAKVRDTQYQLK